MANMFRCTLASGTNSGIPLIVTCASAFAGLTITCTDGTTTLTDVCPSSSPYEITFNLPNVGTWTVSGTISGTTHTESVLVQDINVELKNYINVSVDLYSAANDTVSYIGLDGQSHTITTDSNGHATAVITISDNTSITFTSSVAKDPDNLSSDYTKTIQLSSQTSSVYVMPDNALYWYGYKNNLETCTSANGWYYSTDYNWRSPTYNTNYISFAPPSLGSSYDVSGIGATNSVNTKTIKAITKGDKIQDATNFIYLLQGMDIKGSGQTPQGWSPSQFTNTSLATESSSVSSNVDTYPIVYVQNGGQMSLYALWYE